MKRVKRVWGIILALSLVIGMIAPSVNTKAEGQQQKTVKNIEGVYHKVIVEGTKVKLDNWSIEYIFTFADDSRESYSQYEYVNGQQIAPTLTPDDTLGADGTWSAGEHYWTGNMFGIDFRVNVTVMSLEDTPVQSISAVSTKDLVADWHWGSNFGENTKFLQVTSCYPKIEITYKDGTKESVYYDTLLYRDSNVEPTLELDNTSLEGVGKRTATLQYYGHICTFDVNVIENPVESISGVTTKPLIKDWRGHYSLILDGGLLITVNYKDGSKITGTPDELLQEFYCYPQDYADSELGVGKHTATVEFLGETCDVTFEVIENPNPVVAFDAKAKEAAVLYENTETGREIWYEYAHLVDVTLTYKDGSKISGTIHEVNQKLETIDIKEVWCSDNQWEQQWGIGEYSVEVGYGFDLFSKNVTIKVVENPYKKATISNEDSMTIVLEKANGEKETYKATNFEAEGSMGGNSNMFGYITTDKGVLPVEINFGGGRRANYTDISSMMIHGIKTNALENCEWLEQQMMVEMYGNVPQVSVNNSAEELNQMVLTEADRALNREDSISAKLEVSEKVSVSAEEQKLLDSARSTLQGYEEGVVIDLTLYKEDGQTTEKVSEPNGTLSITMEVPEEVLANGIDPENIKMVRLHDGEAQVLPCVYDSQTKTITFETNAFSTYSMVYKAAASSAITPSPKTGDNHYMVAYVMLCVVSLAVVVANKKRKNQI